MTDAGINPEKAQKLIRDGWIRIDGEYATGPDQLAGKPLAALAIVVEV